MQISVMHKAWYQRRVPTLLVLAGAAILLIAACHKQTAPAPGSITIEHEVSPQPARVGVATITLRVLDASRKAVTGAEITLEGNMSHAGMEPEFTTAKEISRGRYQGQLILSMAGDWVVQVHMTLSDGKKLDQQFEIPAVRSD